MPIIILSDEDCDIIVNLLSREAICGINSARWVRLAELFDKAPDEHTIRIIVHGGVVQHVEQLPMGFNYEVQDFDNCPECGEVEPLCNWCKEARNWIASQKS